MITLSIITINFNNAIGLQRTIESVMSQTFNDFEYILIDGGSSDESIDVIEKYSDKIAYWVSESDNGIYDAMNKGIAVAKGKYCLFLNSGDYLYAKEVLQNVFKNNLTEDIIYGDLALEKNKTFLRTKIHPDKLSDYYLLVEVIGHQAQFIKRILFERFGNYNTQYSIIADYELFIRLFYKHKIITRHLPIIIAVYDLSGLSAENTQVKQINIERHTIQSIYFPKVLAWMYHQYASFLQSKFYNFPLVVSITNFFRDLIFKLIKTNGS